MLPSYEAFLDKYGRIVRNCCSVLRHGHVATFVVANVRDNSSRGQGKMLRLHADTCNAFEEAGMVCVNDAVFQTPLGTAPMRADRIASAASKLVPTHQNVCMYSKGQMLTPAAARAAGIRASDESQSSQQ